LLPYKDKEFEIEVIEHLCLERIMTTSKDKAILAIIAGWLQARFHFH